MLVKKDQGSVIPSGGAPSDPKDLLSAPQLLNPRDGNRFYDDEMQLTWNEVLDADKYWLEIATDAAFKSPALQA